jgi:hypothetical protein
MPGAPPVCAKKRLKPVWRALLCGSRTNKAHGVFDFYDKNTMRRHGRDQLDWDQVT